MITAVMGLQLVVNVAPSFANCNQSGYAPPGGSWGKKTMGVCAEGAYITYHWQLAPGANAYICAEGQRQNPVDTEYIDLQWVSLGCGDSGEGEFLVCPSHHKNCQSLGAMRFKSALAPWWGAFTVWSTTQ
jgi:hypothetical protein